MNAPANTLPASPNRLPTNTGRSKNPLRDLIAVGRMPVILELHHTEADHAAQLKLRQRHLSRGYALPNLTILGQYLRTIEVEDSDLAVDEKELVAKLQTYADLVSSGAVDLIALDDGSRGRETLDNAIAAELLIGLGADPSRLMINMVARNRQTEQIRRRLIHFAELGVRNVLLLTGDLPVDKNAKAVFPLDSIGMLELARRMLIEGSLPDDFWPAAAGHPNPDADPDGLRTLHKALAGAKVIITQAIYSVEQFSEWMQAIQRQGALDMVHVLAEVIPITSAKQLRLIADVPGIRIPRDLIEELDAARIKIEQDATTDGCSSDWTKHRLRREGHRVTRELLHRIRKVPGVSGFYLGCVKSFEPHLELLKESPLLPEHGESLHKVAKISGAERQRALAELPAIERIIRAARHRVENHHRWTVKLARRIVLAKWAEKLFKIIEWPKVPIFGCRKCDQCDLSPDALICPRGCAKQMSHGPCGAPRLVDDRMLCEDTSRECTWAHIRTRREQYGVPTSERISSKTAPSAGFYEGKTYSSFLPVLQGEKHGPNWSLGWRMPIARIVGLFRPNFNLATQSSPRRLTTLAEAKVAQIEEILRDRPAAADEELFLKLLSLIGTPAATALMEAHLAHLGLPAENALNDLSLRERFLLAEALPRARQQLGSVGNTSGQTSSVSVADALLRAIPEGRQLRQAMRRELANGLIRHVAALGMDVSYAASLLETKQVDDFLAALTVLKDELLLVRDRLSQQPRKLAAHFHRIHYKSHYHAPISIRYGYDVDSQPATFVKLESDMRQYQSLAGFRAKVRDALERLSRNEHESAGAILLEDYCPLSRSIGWQFNAEFWKRLREFEAATGVNYDASIGGSTDHNAAYARSAARALYEKIHHHHLENERLFILEVGVAATHRARAFLGEYRRLCELHGTESFRNAVYLLADFSDALLEQAAAEVAREHPSVETVKIDAGDPFAALQAYKGRIIHAHLCNVYDNLPADQAIWIKDSWYRVDVRAYLPRESLDAIIRKHELTQSDRDELESTLQGLHKQTANTTARLLDRLKSRFIELNRGPLAYVAAWMDLFAAIRLEERHIRTSNPAELIAPSLPGQDHANLIHSLHVTDDDLRVHFNLAALSGFAQLLPVLHPHGTLEVIDLFVQRMDEYRQAFKGPAKYDGSTINWLNGPLFRALADQLGFQVRFQPFRPFDPKSPSVVLLAHRRPEMSEDTHG